MEATEKAKRKKLVFISTRIFWPTDSGHKYEIYNYCKGLYDKYGYDIYVYTFWDQNQNIDNISDKPYFIKDIRLANARSSFVKIANVIRYSLLYRKWPLQCSLYYSKKNSRNIQKYATDTAPDVVLVDMIRLGMYYESIENISCKKIIDIDDCLSLRYKKQLLSKRTDSVFGTYNISKFIEKMVMPFGKTILKFEAVLSEKFEKYCYNTFDYCIFVSEKETDYVNDLYKGSKAKTVSMGVADEYFIESKISVIKKPNTAVFVGNFSYPPNIASLDIIIADVLPRINSNIVLNVIGKCPSAIIDKYKKNKNVKFLGFVDDFKTAVLENEIFLSPIAYGTGIKTKIIEAMAFGIPIVTNSVGAEGLEVENGVHLIIEDDFEMIAKAFDRLMADSDLLRRLEKNSKKLVYEKYRWDTILKSFGDLGL